MKLSRYLWMMLALALAACSAEYPVEAVFIEGRIHFEAKDKMTGCLNRFRVESESGEIMWDLDGEYRHSPCQDSFPLAYGVAPSGLLTRVPAKKLEPGVLYKIGGSDGGRYYGAFRYHRTLVITNTPEIARAI